MRPFAAAIGMPALALALVLSQHSGGAPSAAVSPKQLVSPRADDVNVLAWLPACPAVPALAPLAASSRLSGGLCGTGFLTRRKPTLAGDDQDDSSWASPWALRN